MGWFYESFVPGEIFVGWDCGEDIVWGARSHSVECIAQLSSIKPRQSAMDSKSVRSYIFSSAPRAGYRRDERLKPGVPAFHLSNSQSRTPENTGVFSVFAASGLPFSLTFSLTGENKGKFFYTAPTTLSSSLAEVRLASLVA